MPVEEKVGSEEFLKVKRHGRSFYVKVPGDLASALFLKVGDTLRVEIKTLMRGAEEPATAEEASA